MIWWLWFMAQIRAECVFVLNSCQRRKKSCEKGMPPTWWLWHCRKPFTFCDAWPKCLMSLFLCEWIRTRGVRVGLCLIFLKNCLEQCLPNLLGRENYQRCLFNILIPHSMGRRPGTCTLNKCSMCLLWLGQFRKDYWLLILIIEKAFYNPDSWAPSKISEGGPWNLHFKKLFCRSFRFW